MNLDTFLLQRTDNLVGICQHKRYLIITENIRSAITIQIDIGCKNTDDIKERNTIYHIFTSIQRTFIVHLYIDQILNITFRSRIRSYPQILNQINVGLSIGRHLHTIAGCCRNGNGISGAHCSTGIDIQLQ